MTIEIAETFKIPGTDIVLKAGEQIEIEEQALNEVEIPFEQFDSIKGSFKTVQFHSGLPSGIFTKPDKIASIFTSREMIQIKTKSGAYDIVAKFKDIDRIVQERPGSFFISLSDYSTISLGM